MIKACLLLERFTQSHAGYCVSMIVKHRLYVLVYIDHILILSADLATIVGFKDSLSRVGEEN